MIQSLIIDNNWPLRKDISNSFKDKEAMKFFGELKVRVVRKNENSRKFQIEFQSKGHEALELKKKFDEKEFLDEHVDLLKKNLNLIDVEIQYNDDVTNNKFKSPLVVYLNK